MFANFEIKKTLSVLACTILFSATCVISAVGPAQAVAISHVHVVSPQA